MFYKLFILDFDHSQSLQRHNPLELKVVTGQSKVQVDPKAKRPPEQPRQLVELLQETQELSRVAHAIGKLGFIQKSKSLQVQIPPLLYVFSGHSTTQVGPRATSPPEHCVQDVVLLQDIQELSRVEQAKKIRKVNKISYRCKFRFSQKFQRGRNQRI